MQEFGACVIRFKRLKLEHPRLHLLTKDGSYSKNNSMT